MSPVRKHAAASLDYESLLKRFWSLPGEWINTREIAERIGLPLHSFHTYTSKPERFPFEPVATTSNETHHYLRSEVEPWIKQRGRKRTYTTRSREPLTYDPYRNFPSSALMPNPPSQSCDHHYNNATPEGGNVT